MAFVFYVYFFFMKAISKRIQPSIKSKPPKGVMSVNDEISIEVMLFVANK